MKTAITLLALIFSSMILVAETNEPCKGVLVPAEVKSGKLIFEIPTYDEYVHGVVLESLISGETISDENILNETTYNKVRSSKVKAIKATYLNDFEIMTKKEAERNDSGASHIFQEKFETSLVNETNTKFEQYNSFTIKDITTSSQYTLVDPKQDASANCMVKKGAYKFDELIAIIQK